MLQNVDESGGLVNAPCGAATLRYFYDAQGRFSRWEVYDRHGRPATGPSSTAGEQNRFEGYELSDILFFDTTGAPAVHWSGAERWHFEADRFGNRTSLSFQRNDGRLMRGSRGYAEARYVWSEDGRFLRAESFHDVDGAPAVHRTLGVHRIERVRDSLGLLVEVRYLGVDGALSDRKDTGIARVVHRYDGRGVRVQTSSFDQEGRTREGKEQG